MKKTWWYPAQVWRFIKRHPWMNKGSHYERLLPDGKEELTLAECRRLMRERLKKGKKVKA